MFCFFNDVSFDIDFDQIRRADLAVVKPVRVNKEVTFIAWKLNSNVVEYKLSPP